MKKDFKKGDLVKIVIKGNFGGKCGIIMENNPTRHFPLRTYVDGYRISVLLYYKEVVKIN